MITSFDGAAVSAHDAGLGWRPRALVLGPDALQALRDHRTRQALATGRLPKDDDYLFATPAGPPLAEELHNVREACRIFGVHPSTYYRWRPAVLASGLEMLRPRERRPPRMPNQLSELTEQRILAFSLGHPGLGPRRVSATLAQERW